MANTIKSADFFVVGGTLDREAASYVQRPADDDLLRRTLAGEYCNVLAARQTGKSSLMVQTAERLKSQGVKTVIIDLTSIGSMVSASEWYFGLLSYLSRHLGLSVDERAWWNARKETGPVQRFSDFLHEVILNEIHEPIVIFIDEIDSTLKLKFTDDFFAAIRAAYNARSQNADLKRLTFVLLGVARPTDLIKDRTRTPYNIGIGIDITDFQIDELGRFESILEKAYPRQGRQILEWVLEWTGGQPYLTQKLCSELVEQANGLASEDQLAQLVERLFLGDMARKETNLRSIRDQTKNNPYLAKMLRIYKRLLANQQVLADEQSVEQNELKLAGLVKTTPQGALQVRNRIYRDIFGENWVQESMPVSTTQRLAVVTSIIAVLAIAVAGYSYYQQQNQTAEILAGTYTDNFNNSNSQEVKISSLAGLFLLGGDYVVQAREIFGSLNHEQQLALFDLATPANVGAELVVVVGGIHGNVENTPDGNTLLKAMADTLAQTASPDATTLTLEINTWLDARGAVSRDDYPSAINLYIRAFEYSKDRNNENATILMERASIYTLLEQYNDALVDYDNVVGIDAGRAGEVQTTILRNQTLVDYWREHSDSYSNLSSSIAIPTKLPASTATALPDEITDARGAQMVLVPAAEFIMGSDSYPAEQPVHNVYLDNFYINKYEVTNASFAEFLNSIISDAIIESNGTVKYKGKIIYDLTCSDCSTWINRIVWDGSRFNVIPKYVDHPVTNVSWYGADAYCTMGGSHLPTEAEWEKAARGTDGRTYPWGEEISCNSANYYDDSKNRMCVGDTSGVKNFPADKSEYDVYDMAGNVSEWVGSKFQNYPYVANVGREEIDSSYPVFRGGSWRMSVSITARNWASTPEVLTSMSGFRCAHPTNEPLVECMISNST
ncbi:MAG: SUMF1/EgtB/PvdO family nonheme iron enzyme [Anaerolineales bacterium]